MRSSLKGITYRVMSGFLKCWRERKISKPGVYGFFCCAASQGLPQYATPPTPGGASRLHIMTDIRRRTVFFVSDGTGITAETLGHSLLAQFPEAKFRQVRAPFVDDIDKAIECATQIREAAIDDGVRPIVFSTLVNQTTVDALHKADALFLDLFDRFI